MEDESNEISVTNDDVVSWSKTIGEPRQQMQTFVYNRVQTWHDAWKDHSWQITVQHERELPIEELHHRLDDIYQKKSDITLFLTTSLGQTYLTEVGIKSLQETNELLIDLAKITERQIRGREVNAGNGKSKKTITPVLSLEDYFKPEKKKELQKLLPKIISDFKNAKPKNLAALIVALQETGFLIDNIVFTQFHSTLTDNLGYIGRPQSIESHTRSIKKKADFKKLIASFIVKYSLLKKRS